MATSSTAFVPDGTATYQGYFTRPGLLYVGGLSAGVPYYFRLVGGNRTNGSTEPSDAATGYTGLTTSSDYGVATIGTGAVSFDARSIGGVTNTVGTATPSDPQTNDVWIDTSGGAAIHKVYNGSTWVTNAWGSASIAAGQITAVQLAAGAVTAGAIAADAITGKTITGGTIVGSYIAGGTMASGYLSSGTVNGGYITGGTISGGYVTGGTVNGALVTGGTVQGPLIKTAASGGRVELNSTYGADSVMWYDSGGTFVGSIGSQSSGIGVLGSLFVSGIIRPYTSTADLFLMAGTGGGDSAYLNCQNVYDQTSGSSANIVVGSGGRLIRSTSRAAEKYRIVPLVHELANVPANKIATPEAEGAVDIWDVLDLAPSQFARHENSKRVLDPETGEEITPAPEVTYLGFIAEDVAAKFPVAAEWDEVGDPASYDVRAIVSALLGVVSEQQDTITALTARIEALEA